MPPAVIATSSMHDLVPVFRMLEEKEEDVEEQAVRYCHSPLPTSPPIQNAGMGKIQLEEISSPSLLGLAALPPGPNSRGVSLSSPFPEIPPHSLPQHTPTPTKLTTFAFHPSIDLDPYPSRQTPCLVCLELPTPHTRPANADKSQCDK
jgi:hypothetical protein